MSFDNETFNVKQKIILSMSKWIIDSLWIYTDFISKQKTLELSQSGIGFVMGWNLAKS